MANISSYNQLSSWNEDDDLLFVQQPDAPKKAHPSQMKEYILEGLDVESVGGTGKYISAISEADGKISATAETMDDAPTENSNAPVKSGGIKTAIDDSVSLKTATGNPITLADAANANAEDLSMTIKPIQSGSGDPSPDNVRPISGLTIGEVQTTNGTDTNTATITFGQTVYGGSVNFKTGEVTVTHGIKKFSEMSWYKGTQSFYTSGIDAIKIDGYLSDKFLSDYYTPVLEEWNNLDNGCCVLRTGISNAYYSLAVRDDAYNTTSDFITAQGDRSICYELATPLTLTLTPAELELLKGNNTITANGAEINLKYYPDNAIGALAGRVDGKADEEDVDNIKDVKVTDTFSASPTRQGAYIVTSGDTVDITSFVTNNLWQCWIFPVVPGDSFVITVEGGNVPRAYCFIDENGNVLSKADDSEYLTQALITADKRGFCIIQNNTFHVPNPSIVGTLTVPNSAYAKIGDLSQTGFTGDSVAAQLGGAREQISALADSRAKIIKVSSSDAKVFTFSKNVWSNSGLSGQNHTALFCGGYAGRISAGFLGLNNNGVSVIQLGENPVTVAINGNNVDITFTNTIWSDLYLILFN